MNIESIGTFVMSPGRPSFFLVRVCTDTGITGWGAGAYFSYPEALERIVNRFKIYLVGTDPLQIERHWNVLFRSSPFRGADKMAALSAVDIALWDIAGKYFETPAYQLMGGKQRDKVRLHYLMACSSMNTIDELVKRAEHAVKEGSPPSNWTQSPPTISRCALAA